MDPSLSSASPFRFGVGDHRTLIIDLPSDLLLGDDFVPLVKSLMRRLTQIQPQSVYNCASKSESSFENHHVQMKVDDMSD